MKCTPESHVANSFIIVQFTSYIRLIYTVYCILGRDYRQNPLAADNGLDEPIFDEFSEISKSQIVSPSLARAVLTSPKGKISAEENKGFFKSPLGKKESEFAREMLMFPLSIKNPAVSLMASRLEIFILLLIIYEIFYFLFGDIVMDFFKHFFSLPCALTH